MEIVLNGVTKEIDRKLGVDELLSMFGLPTERVAIEINGDVVRRRDWPNVSVKEGDRIEVVHFVGGG